LIILMLLISNTGKTTTRMKGTQNVRLDIEK
jgi:hypothetical protein